jgi:acyl carrier protein
MSSLDQVLELLRKRRTGEGAEVGPEDHLADLGLDSIDLAYVLSTFERTHDADFADEDFDLECYGTVRSLAEVIDAKLSA